MGNLQGKRLLFVITKSNWGGAQHYVYMLATRCHHAGAQVRVAFGGTGDAGATTGTLSERLAAAGIRTIFLKAFARDVGFRRDGWALFELVRMIRNERPDVLHVNSSKAGGLGALAGRLAGVPKIVFTSHGLAYDEDRSLLVRGLIWLFTWMTFLLAHTVIVISQDNYERARRLPFCRRKIRLIHNAVEPIQLMPRALARAALIEHAHDDVPWIGTVAELTRNKGLSYLLDAATLLKQRGLRFKLCIIGAGEERTALEEKIHENGLQETAYLMGFVTGAARYLAAFDIFTLTSVKEGLPYVLLEAAQATCAVVASRISGVTDIVDASTGILVAPKDAAAIADALETLLTSENRRKALGEALHKRVLEKFSVERMLENITQTYLATHSS